MGFFDGLLRGLGFEVEQKQKKDKKQKLEPKKEETAYTGAGAKFELEKKQEKPKQENLKPKEIIVNNQLDVQKVIENAKSYSVIIVDLINLSQSDFVRALDFLSGAMFALGGRIQKISDKKFFLSL